MAEVKPSVSMRWALDALERCSEAILTTLHQARASEWALEAREIGLWVAVEPCAHKILRVRIRRSAPPAKAVERCDGDERTWKACDARSSEACR